MSEAFPPPDVPCDLPTLVRVEGVLLTCVGYVHEEPDVEVLASTPSGVSYRFHLPKSAVAVRDFWMNIGVTNVFALEAGAYEDPRGCGPYLLSGMLIGEDYPMPGMGPPPEDEEEPPNARTQVLLGVRLEKVVHKPSPLA